LGLDLFQSTVTLGSTIIAGNTAGGALDIAKNGATINTSHLGFTGALTDESGLVDLNARVYSPSLGDFLSADPLEGTAANPPSYNEYGYVQGNPVNDAVGELRDQAAASRPKRVGRVVLRGISLSQLMARVTLIAAAVKTNCKCVLA